MLPNTAPLTLRAAGASCSHRAVRTRRISPYFDVLEDDAGQQRLVVYLSGIALLRGG
jgi:hypothetical protein